MAELPAALAELLRAALAARERAYCPYSRFAVGAAALGASGAVYPGCNIENASYPATVCGERAALFGAYSAGEHDIAALAIVADTPGPVSPCGICRQVIVELAPRATVLLASTHGSWRIVTPQQLLPDAFDPRDLPGT